MDSTGSGRMSAGDILLPLVGGVMAAATPGLARGVQVAAGLSEHRAAAAAKRQREKEVRKRWEAFTRQRRMAGEADAAGPATARALGPQGIPSPVDRTGGGSNAPAPLALYNLGGTAGSTAAAPRAGEEIAGEQGDIETISAMMAADPAAGAQLWAEMQQRDAAGRQAERLFGRELGNRAEIARQESWDYERRKREQDERLAAEKKERDAADAENRRRWEASYKLQEEAAGRAARGEEAREDARPTLARAMDEVRSERVAGERLAADKAQAAADAVEEKLFKLLTSDAYTALRDAQTANSLLPGQQQQLDAYQTLVDAYRRRIAQLRGVGAAAEPAAASSGATPAVRSQIVYGRDPSTGRPVRVGG